MNNSFTTNNTKDIDEDLNTIIASKCNHYIQEIDNDFLSQNDFTKDIPDDKDLESFFNTSETDFKKIQSLLTYSKETAQNGEEAQDSNPEADVNKARRHHQGLAQAIENKMLKNIMFAKLPSLNPGIASYLINRGNYDLMNLSIKGQSNFDSNEATVYGYMNKVIQKKLCVAILPEEDLEYEIKEGMLKVIGPSFCFELTIEYDARDEDFNWRLFTFEHKLGKFSNIDKKVDTLNDDITGMYTGGQREKEIYVILYLVYKMKYFYSRKKLKAIVKGAEVLQKQFEVIGSEEVFEINHKIVSDDMILLRIHYWKNSLLHSLNPNHRYNCLIFHLPNLNIPNFAAEFDKNVTNLFFGLSQDEVACIYHEPYLPAAESLTDLSDLLSQSENPISVVECYKKVQETIIFQTSKRVMLPGFTLEASFFEIFNEIRRIFQTYLLLNYFRFLYRKIKKSDIQNIYLSVRDGIKSSKPGGTIVPSKIFLCIEIETKTLLISIDPTNGKVDFNFDFLTKDVEIHKAKFKSILRQNPQRIMQIIHLFKKLLLISAFNQFLLRNGAKFYPERENQTNDNFNSITYVSHGAHSVGLDMINDIIKIVFSHKLEFDELLENLSITTNIQFRYLHPRPTEQASFVLKSVISLIDFDIQRISKEFGELLTTKRCLAYYNLEISKMESAAGNNMSISLNDTQKFLPKVGPTLDQTLSTSDNTILITIKPSNYVVNTYNNYFDSNEGLKLIFATQRPKIYETYSNGKLTIKYATVVDAYQQIQKDIERLEEHIRYLRLDNSEEMDEESDSQQLHAYSFHQLSSSFSVRFSGDRLIDIQPSRYHYLKPYHNNFLKEEKERNFQKKLFLKEIKQALPILEFSTDLNEKKIDLKPSQPRPREDNDGELDADMQAEREKEREKIANLARWISKYHFNIITLDPWHHVLSWRSFFEPNIVNFFMNFQLLPTGEFECFDIHYDYLDSVERERIPETHVFYTHIKKLFIKYTSPAPNMNGMSHQNNDMNYLNTGLVNPNSLRIRLNTKSDFIRFMSQLTVYFVTISSHLRSKNTLMATAINSAGSTGNSNHSINQSQNENI